MENLIPHNRDMVKDHVLIYQHINHLISLVLYTRDDQKLSEETKLLLNCSITIHPYLTKRSHNSKHPDYAVFAKDLEPHITDIELYDEYIYPAHKSDLFHEAAGLEKLIPKYQARIYRSFAFSETQPQHPNIDWDTLTNSTQDATTSIAASVAAPPTSASTASVASTASSAATIADDEYTTDDEDEEDEDASTDYKDDEKSLPITQPKHPTSVASKVVVPKNIDRRFNTKVIAFLSQLFDKKTRDNIFTYDELRSTWKRLNGPDSIGHRSRAGGSHRELNNSQGETIGGCFIPHHAKDKEYSKKNAYFKYILRAFEKIGITKEWLQQQGYM